MGVSSGGPEAMADVETVSGGVESEVSDEDEAEAEVEESEIEGKVEGEESEVEAEVKSEALVRDLELRLRATGGMIGVRAGKG